MTKSAQALESFRQGFNCAQSVLVAFGPEAGMDKELCYKVAGSFGAGMARRGETCGAVSGGLMVLGLRHAMTKENDAQAKKNNYDEAEAFLDKFKACHGSILCKELLGHDISTPEGAKAAKDKGLFTTLCPKLVGSAVEMLEKK
jgi:C_GCAxxG_C_C family probable redox protein